MALPIEVAIFAISLGIFSFVSYKKNLLDFEGILIANIVGIAIFLFAKWNLAFAFTPPQPVTFKGAGMQFPIGSLNGNTWSVGFCKPRGLDGWRKGR